MGFINKEDTDERIDRLEKIITVLFRALDESTDMHNRMVGYSRQDDYSVDELINDIERLHEPPTSD